MCYEGGGGGFRLKSISGAQPNISVMSNKTSSRYHLLRKHMSKRIYKKRISACGRHLVKIASFKRTHSVRSIVFSGFESRQLSAIVSITPVPIFGPVTKT